MTAIDCTGPVEATEKTCSPTPQRHSLVAGTAKNSNAGAQPSTATKQAFGAKSRGDLAEFFRRNPGEELSIEDAAQKLGVSLTTAAARLSTLAGQGLLERVSVYRLRAKEQS